MFFKTCLKLCHSQSHLMCGYVDIRCLEYIFFFILEKVGIVLFFPFSQFYFFFFGFFFLTNGIPTHPHTLELHVMFTWFHKTQTPSEVGGKKKINRTKEKKPVSGDRSIFERRKNSCRSLFARFFSFLFYFFR